MRKNNLPDTAKRALLVVLAALILAVAGLMLRPTSPTAAQDVPVPIAPPDAEAALSIYYSEAQGNCFLCHGDAGDGQGTDALEAGLQPTAFANPEYRLTADPTNMYSIITNGNMSAGMPPYGPANSNPLNEADIWNLIALAYSCSTRPEAVAAGKQLANELGADTETWPGLDYWFSRSNQAILAELENEDIFGVEIGELSDDEKLSLIDYGRSLHYTYTDPLAAFAPVSLATINGQVINGSTGEAIPDGEVRLRAFTSSFEEVYSETMTVSEDGSFDFQIEDVPNDWIFLADVAYGDLTFNSDAVQFSNLQTEVELPLFVFDTTTDPSVVSIDRLHIILTFAENRLIVTELYVFSNLAPAALVGETGDFEQGTIRLGMPAEAENISFQRGFGTSMDSFLPATDFIQTDGVWADTVPLRPGTNSLNLLVNYELPYDDGLQLEHSLEHSMSGGASIIMADAGVTISDSSWVSQGPQTTATGTFESYVNSNLVGADAISLTLDGNPTQVMDAQGNVLPARNETNELIIGGVALAGMLAVGFFLVQRWRTTPAVQSSAGATPHAAAAPPRQATLSNSQRKELLAAIADLDEAFDAGELSEAAYQSERRALKDKLTAVW